MSKRFVYGMEVEPIDEKRLEILMDRLTKHMEQPLWKKTLMHGLELLGVLVASFVLQFLLNEVLPSLPQTEMTMFFSVVLGSLIKYLRANPKFPSVPDYVNK